MITTIQISSDLVENLQKLKLFSKETYEEVIWDLIEDRMELSEETKTNIKTAEKQIKNGETVSFEEIKRKYSSKCGR